MFVEGHTDQIRSFKGLEELSFSNEDIDWSTKKVVVVSKYDTHWSKNKDFTQAMKDGNIKALKESGKVALTVTSRHLYGSGMDWHSYMFYESWSDFAAYEESNFGGAMNANDIKFWSSIDAHEDEILMWIGGMSPDTKVFDYAK